jgi:hypothetical protein
MPTLLLLLLTASHHLADCYCFPVFLPTAAFLLLLLLPTLLLLLFHHPAATAALTAVIFIVIITHLRLEQHFWIYDGFVKAKTTCPSQGCLSMAACPSDGCCQ